MARLMSRGASSRVLIGVFWTAAGTIIGAALGISLLTEPMKSWTLIDPWLALGFAVGWAGLLIAIRREDRCLPAWTITLALAWSSLAIYPVRGLAAWWKPGEGLDPRSGIHPVFLAWAAYGAIFGLMGGFAVGLLQARSRTLTLRLSNAGFLACLWSVTLAVAGLVYVPVSYQAMSWASRLPLPSDDVLVVALGLTGAVLGLAVGAVSGWVREVGRDRLK